MSKKRRYCVIQNRGSRRRWFGLCNDAIGAAKSRSSKLTGVPYLVYRKGQSVPVLIALNGEVFLHQEESDL